jgi:hypothetical protein
VRYREFTAYCDPATVVLGRPAVMHDHPYGIQTVPDSVKQQCLTVLKCSSNSASERFSHKARTSMLVVPISSIVTVGQVKTTTLQSFNPNNHRPRESNTKPSLAQRTEFATFLCTHIEPNPSMSSAGCFSRPFGIHSRPSNVESERPPLRENRIDVSAHSSGPVFFSNDSF